MYKAIIFDLYGTLLDIHTDESQPLLWDKLAHLFGTRGAHYTAEALQEGYLSHVELLLEKKRAKGIDHPDIDILKVFKHLYKVKNVKASKQALIETAKFFRLLSLEYVKPYPGATPLLEYWQYSNYKVLLLSNAQESFTMDELHATGTKKYFDAIFLSSQHKVAKPSKDFFQILLDKEKLAAHECLFIGNDHTTDIEGATQMGMDSIYIHTNCSQSDVPETIDAKWRFDSGNLFEVMDLIKSIHELETMTIAHVSPDSLPDSAV